MVVVTVAITLGIRAQVAESQTTLLSRTTNDLFASYTPLEKKLMFPVLAIVWLLVKCFQQSDRKKGLTGGGNDDRKSGGNVEEEKSHHKVDNISSRGSSGTGGTNDANNTHADNWNIAKSILHQKQASAQSLRIQQKAHDASIDHQNQMLKRKHVANRRLQQRLAAKDGSLPSSFQLQPLKQLQKNRSSKTKVLPISFNATLVANLLEQHQTVKQVDAIRKKSEASRQQKAHDTNERRKLSATQLQKRLALRQQNQTSTGN
jgi:hypothetical protein